MIHDYERIATATYRCKMCGIKVYTEGPIDDIRLDCPGPSLAQQVAHYAEAVATHIATGAKTRTDDEVARLLGMCQTCEHYDAERSRCRVCGCRLSTASNALTNKLRMTTQHCPRGRW